MMGTHQEAVVADRADQDKGLADLGRDTGTGTTRRESGRSAVEDMSPWEKHSHTDNSMGRHMEAYTEAAYSMDMVVVRENPTRYHTG